MYMNIGNMQINTMLNRSFFLEYFQYLFMYWRYYCETICHHNYIRITRQVIPSLIKNGVKDNSLLLPPPRLPPPLPFLCILLMFLQISVLSCPAGVFDSWLLQPVGQSE